MAEFREISSELRARTALERCGFRHAHSLGQNFILDSALINHLLDAAEVAPEDCVLEIGPGAGVMTAELCRRAARVLAYEVDGKLIPVLESVLEGFENIRLVNEDFLRARDFGGQLRACFGDVPYRVIANLPYYITTDIILRLIGEPTPPESICVMVQREAAERIMSSPGSKQWCAMAASVQLYGNASILLDVLAEAFDPPPHVESCFIRIERHEVPSVQPEDPALLRRLIGAAFAMRRKTLANNLKASFGLDQARAGEILRKANLDERVRGEALTLAQLSRVSDLIHEQLQKP